MKKFEIYKKLNELFIDKEILYAFEEKFIGKMASEKMNFTLQTPSTKMILINEKISELEKELKKLL